MVVMRTKNMVDTEKKNIGVMVTKKLVIHATNKDPKLLAMEGVALALVNADNVDKMVDDLNNIRRKCLK